MLDELLEDGGRDDNVEGGAVRRDQLALIAAA